MASAFSEIVGRHPLPWHCSRRFGCALVRDRAGRDVLILNLYGDDKLYASIQFMVDCVAASTYESKPKTEDTK